MQIARQQERNNGQVIRKVVVSLCFLVFVAHVCIEAFRGDVHTPSRNVLLSLEKGKAQDSSPLSSDARETSAKLDREILNYSAEMTRMQDAMNPIDPFISPKEKIEEYCNRGEADPLPLAQSYSIDDMMKLDLTAAAKSRRVVYFITPTYQNPAQIVDFTRLKQTLQLASMVSHQLIYWIVVEDSKSCTQRIRDIIEDSGLPFAHVAVQSAKDSVHKGVPQRNRGLEIVEQVGAEGMVYFGDDDNAYDTQLFSELAATKRVSLLAVGFSANKAYERCLVDENTGRVTDIVTDWVAGRKFPMDMAGFAFSTAALLEKRPRFQESWRHEHLETLFMEQIADSLDDFEPLGAHCTRILAWHTKTRRATLERVKQDDRERFKLIKRLI